MHSETWYLQVQPTVAQKFQEKTVLYTEHVQIWYSINSMTQQLIMYHLLCAGHYKESRDYLTYMGALYKLHTNITPFCIRALSVLRFCHLWELPDPIPCKYWGIALVWKKRKRKITKNPLIFSIWKMKTENHFETPKIIKKIISTWCVFLKVENCKS